MLRDSKSKLRQTEVGMIPEDWEAKSLGDLGECLIGLTYEPENVREYGVLVLRSSNVADGRLAFDDNVYVDIDIPERIRVKKGDILICVRNGSRALIGKCALLDNQVEGQTFGAFMSVFRTTDSEYIFHQFQSDNIQRQIHENIGATINQITNKNLKAFVVPYPNDPQERDIIAQCLTETGVLIASLEKLIAKKRAIKQGTMQELLTGKRRLPGFSEKWETKSFGSLIELRKGEQLNKSELTETGEYPDWNGGVEPSGYTHKWNTIKNTITISEGGNSCGFVNFCKQKFWLGGHCYALKITTDCLDKNFLFQLLKYREKAIMNLRIGSGLPNIQKKNLNEFELFLSTDVYEQTAIAGVLRNMDAEIDTLKQQLAKYKMLKQGMMQVLLTGRIRLV
jgi:type I restriction enzyme S subunit